MYNEVSSHLGFEKTEIISGLIELYGLSMGSDFRCLEGSIDKRILKSDSKWVGIKYPKIFFEILLLIKQFIWDSFQTLGMCPDICIIYLEIYKYFYQRFAWWNEVCFLYLQISLIEYFSV